MAQQAGSKRRQQNKQAGRQVQESAPTQKRNGGGSAGGMVHRQVPRQADPWQAAGRTQDPPAQKPRTAEITRQAAGEPMAGRQAPR